MRERSSIPLPSKHMGMLVVWWVAALRRLPFIAEPGCPAEPKPVPAAFAVAEAAQTNAVSAAFAPLAVVVQLILDVVLAT